MTDDLLLRRKWTFQAHGQKLVVIKKVNERFRHVLMKALLWGLYLPTYPDLMIEIPIGGRYKPDAVALNARREPRFWGEAGKVSSRKMRHLLKHYRQTHLAFGVWRSDLILLKKRVHQAMRKEKRAAQVDLIRFPADSAKRFVDDGNQIQIGFEDLDWARM
jgi:hypothetical protein